MTVDIVNFLQALKKYLIMLSPKHSITANIQGTVNTVQCATYNEWPGLLLIVLYLVLNTKSLDTPAIQQGQKKM